MPVVVCVVLKLRPCLSYNRCRDRINSVLLRSLDKRGGGALENTTELRKPTTEETVGFVQSFQFVQWRNSYPPPRRCQLLVEWNLRALPSPEDFFHRPTPEPSIPSSCSSCSINALTSTLFSLPLCVVCMNLQSSRRSTDSPPYRWDNLEHLTNQWPPTEIATLDSGPTRSLIPCLPVLFLCALRTARRDLRTSTAVDGSIDIRPQGGCPHDCY